nr:hypothetical protein [Actinomycetota bacterium]
MEGEQERESVTGSLFPAAIQPRPIPVEDGSPPDVFEREPMIERLASFGWVIALVGLLYIGVLTGLRATGVSDDLGELVNNGAKRVATALGVEQNSTPASADDGLAQSDGASDDGSPASPSSQKSETGGPAAGATGPGQKGSGNGGPGGGSGDPKQDHGPAPKSDDGPKG